MSELKVNRATVIEWLDANEIEVTHTQLAGLFSSAIEAAQAQPYDQQAMGLCQVCGWKGVIDYPDGPVCVACEHDKTLSPQPTAQPTIAQMKEYCKQASAMMARDLTRFDAACEVMGYLKEMRAPGYYMHRMNIVLHGNVEGTDAARASDKAAQPAAEAKGDDPDMFWDADDTENFAHEIQDIVDGYGPGEIVTIECAKRLPNLRVVVTRDGDGLSYEYLEAAIVAQEGGAHG